MDRVKGQIFFMDGVKVNVEGEISVVHNHCY